MIRAMGLAHVMDVTHLVQSRAVSPTEVTGEGNSSVMACTLISIYPQNMKMQLHNTMCIIKSEMYVCTCEYMHEH